MKKSLGSFVIQGISHNISFLEALIHHKRFSTGDIHTGFIEEEYPDGFSGAKLTSALSEVFLATALFIFLTEQKRDASLAHQLSDQSHKIGTRWIVTIDKEQYPVIIKPIMEDGYNIRHGTNRLTIRSNWNIGTPLIAATINGQKIHTKVERIITGYRLTYLGITLNTYVRSPKISELEALILNRDEEEGDNDEQLLELKAPLAGQIVRVSIKEGDRVVPGQELLVLTAMKMENIITAEHESIVSKILVSRMDHVASGQPLIKFE
jgi:propionyl-CoA carboxylase alpha chain